MWDNAKIFTWVHLVLTIPVALLLAYIWKMDLAHKIMALILFSILIFSGLLDTIHLLQFKSTRISMFTNEELSLAQFVNVNLEKEAVFLTSDYHVHWLPVLTGRQIVMGYKGWLWSYGIDYSQRENEVIQMYQGGDQAVELFNRYSIDYVIIGPHEINSLNPNLAWFDQNFEIAFSTPTTNIHIVSK